MRVLVTGGAGFIGSHLVERLIARGTSVAIVDDFNDFYDPAIKRSNIAAVRRNVPVFQIDLRDNNAVRSLFHQQQFDVIVHLAARAGVRPSIDEIACACLRHKLMLVRARQIGHMSRFGAARALRCGWRRE